MYKNFWVLKMNQAKTRATT